MDAMDRSLYFICIDGYPMDRSIRSILRILWILWIWILRILWILCKIRWTVNSQGRRHIQGARRELIVLLKIKNQKGQCRPFVGVICHLFHCRKRALRLNNEKYSLYSYLASLNSKPCRRPLVKIKLKELNHNATSTLVLQLQCYIRLG